MILVFILLGIILLISITIIVLILSTIKIKIKELKLKNNTKNTNKYKIKIGIYFLNKIPIFWININQKKIKDIKKAHKFKNRNNKIKFKDVLKILQILNIKIKNIKLSIDLGTENVILTSYLVAIIASIIGIILPHITSKDKIDTCGYIVNPRYNNKNEYNIELNGIIYIQIINIICSILFLIKQNRNKNQLNEYCIL